MHISKDCYIDYERELMSLTYYKYLDKSYHDL